MVMLADSLYDFKLLSKGAEKIAHIFSISVLKFEIDWPLELTEVDDVGPNFYSSDALLFPESFSSLPICRIA
jgi:hypothetical protein